MKYRQLNGTGIAVSAIGYGAYGLGGAYGAVNTSDARRVLELAIQLGINFFDTADVYSEGENERLLGEVLGEHENDIIVATKFGQVQPPTQDSVRLDTNYEGFDIYVDASPAAARRCIDASLRRLRRGCIDLWYLHWPDPRFPLEETIGTMAEMVAAGKVRYLGVSNVSAEQLRTAADVAPIVAVQREYSLWSRRAEQGLLQLSQELDMSFVSWAPLGLGFLTGAVELTPNDARHAAPRFSVRNFETNRQRFTGIQAFAQAHQLSQAQAAIGWLLSRGEHVIPIPGTSSPKHLRDNVNAIDIELGIETWEELSALCPEGLAIGDTII